MSIWSVRCLSQKLYHQLCIMAYSPKLLSASPQLGSNRMAHNSLYQMVKKRTLEARSKLQANKYPNHQACMASRNSNEFVYELDTCETTTVPTCPPPCVQDPLVKVGYVDSALVCSPSDVLKSSECREQDRIVERKATVNRDVERNFDRSTERSIDRTSDHRIGDRNIDGFNERTSNDRLSEHASIDRFSNRTIDRLNERNSIDRINDRINERTIDRCIDRSIVRMREKSPKVDSCKQKDDPCEEFHKMRRDSDCVFGDDGDDPCNPKDGPEDELRKLRLKCLLGMLAALLAGGFLTWLLSRPTDTSEEDEKKEEALKRALLSGAITSPPSSAELPKHIPFLIIGGGTAALSAYRSIRSNVAGAKVLMITNEMRKPYMRPPLSKELWFTDYANDDPVKDYRYQMWSGLEKTLSYEPDRFYVDPAKIADSVSGGLAVALGFTVKQVDAQKRIVTLSDGYQIGYDKCLIATGCVPKNLFMFRDASPSVREKVMVYRTPDDFDRLRRYADEKRTITIVGDGTIGSELASSLAFYSKDICGGKVYQVFPEKGNMSKTLPTYLSRWTMLKLQEMGVCVIPDASIKTATRDESHLKLELNNGQILITDIVVVCVGSTPNTTLANPSKLAVDRNVGGFVVNTELEASRNLFVAGDVTCFTDQQMDKRRVENFDHSIVSGRVAGENMTGAKKAFTHQSFFWTDLGPDISYEGIGIVDSTLPTVGIFSFPTDEHRTEDYLTESRSQENLFPADHSSGKETYDSFEEKVNCAPTDDCAYGKGVIFYLKKDKVVGILLWNLFDRIGLARSVLDQDTKYEDLNDVAKRFQIHA